MKAEDSRGVLDSQHAMAGGTLCPTRHGLAPYLGHQYQKVEGVRSAVPLWWTELCPDMYHASGTSSCA